LNVDLAYQHRFGSLGTNLTTRFIDFGDSFSVQGRKYSHDGFVGALNCVANLAEYVDFYVELSGSLWSNHYYYAGTIGIRSTW